MLYYVVTHECKSSSKFYIVHRYQHTSQEDISAHRYQLASDVTHLRGRLWFTCTWANSNRMFVSQVIQAAVQGFQQDLLTLAVSVSHSRCLVLAIDVIRSVNFPTKKLT